MLARFSEICWSSLGGTGQALAVEAVGLVALRFLPCTHFPISLIGHALSCGISEMF
jgi:hypothetical protein